MKKAIKTIANETGLLLKDCIQLILFFVRYLSHGRAKMALATESMEKCLYVLGNGPSLKTFLQDNEIDRTAVDLCCVNFSPMTDLFKEIKPRYLFFADPGLYNLNDQRVQKTAAGLETIDWPLTLVVIHDKLEKAKTIYSKNPTIDFISAPTYPLLLHSKLLRKYCFRLWKRGVSMPSPINVIIFAIFTGINLGYKKMYLYGVEHSLLKETFVNNDNIPCLYSAHFYGAPEKPWGTKHPDGTLYNIADLLEDFAKLFRAYFILNDYSHYIGDVSITNRTKGSWIDAFPREV